MSKRNTKKRALSKPIFLLALFSFGALAGLAVFRITASQLEYRLGGIEESIERYSKEEVELKQSLSSLTSPIRIYSYCKDKLGMNAAHQEVMHLPRAVVAEAVIPQPQKGWRASLFAFFGLTVN